MLTQLENCKLCPRACGANRTAKQTGFCKASDRVKIARSALHHWEEPCLSGTKGSGTVFFSHCTLGCVFCQNYEISTKHCGMEISNEELSEVFLDLAALGAHNINLVTPTHYVPQIVKALTIAKDRGLNLPVVYNSSGYERVETLKLLEGVVSIYLPDIKYFSEKYAVKYSNAPDYFNYATKAIEEMYRQVGEASFDEDGIMKKGVIVRHLMLPGLLFDSKKIVDYIYKTYGDNIYFSLMNQYTPLQQVAKYPQINHLLNPIHYDFMVDYALNLGMQNAFIQEEGTAKESFIPPFNEATLSF